MTRSHLRLASVVGAIVLSGVAMAPALAATNLSSAGANAITLSVGGNEAASTGDYTAVNDGSGTKTSGNNKPAVDLLTNQDLISAGTLAQDATATASGGSGRSAACAGLAGQGASVAAVGDGNCLTGGNVLTLDAGTVDLSKINIVEGTVTDGLPAELKTVLTQLNGGLQMVTGPASSALSTVLTQLGNPGVVANLQALEGRCTASPGQASGDARLANANLQVRFPSQANVDPLTILTLPEKPAPNTDYSADLGQLSALVLKDLKAQLTTGLGGALSPLVSATDQATIVNNILTNVSTQLQPLTKQLVSIIANKQSRPAAGAIRVSALDVRVLPGQVMGVDGLHLQVGNVVCGPSGREVTAAPAAPAPKKPALPTAVSAGYGEMPAQYAGEGDDHTTGLILGAFALLVATGAGAATFRRLRG